MASKRITTLKDLTQDPHNANKGTDAGREMLAHSLRDYGAGRSILADKNGVVIAGNKTLEQAAAAGITNIIVVPTTGDSIVVHQRTDLDLNEDRRAKELAIADNRVSEIDLQWDAEALQGMGDLSKFFNDAEIAKLTDTFEAGTADEQSQLDQDRTHTCPQCGHEFKA